MSDSSAFSIDSATDAAAAGELDRWVREFLASPGSDNAELGRQLQEEYPAWAGPLQLPFDRLHRLAGPPDQPTLERLDDDDLETVEAMEDSIDGGWTPPPFVVTWQRDHLVLEDGNHRVEGLRRAGRRDHACVIGFRSAEVRDRFVAGLENG